MFPTHGHDGVYTADSLLNNVNKKIWKKRKRESFEVFEMKVNKYKTVKDILTLKKKNVQDFPR